MKNNELLLSVRFLQDNEEFSFLVHKDITLRAFLEALYYGLQHNDTEHFGLFKYYLQTHTQLAVLYRSKKELEVIEVKDSLENKLYQLDIVTTSCVVIPDTKNTSLVTLYQLFPDYQLDALCNQDKPEYKMEYNISTRRITVAENSVIDILPSGEIPVKQDRKFRDVIIPTCISLAAMFVSRILMSFFLQNSSGISMMAMMMATSLSTMVTQSYNFVNQGKKDKKSVEEWKANYENYLSRIWDRIIEWQKSDINYLCTTYPDIEKLFEQTSILNRAIFSRSQNDLDFFRIRLGESEQVEPMFEIKNERKDEIVSQIEYVIHKGEERKIEMLLPEPDEKEYTSHLERERNIRNPIKAKFERIERKYKERKRKKLPPRPKADGYLTDLPSDLANRYFQYLKAEDTSHLPPLILNLKSCGTLGIVETDGLYSQHLIEHIIFELAYYHTPEDLQFVIFFPQTSDKQEQLRLIQNYKYLPHMNELFEDASQFVFNKESAGIVFGKLQSIMSERTKEQSEADKEENVQEVYTQIVCIVFNDYGIKETGFSKYLPQPPKEGEDYVNNNGLTFIFARKNLSLLPRYCGNIIEIKKDAQGRKDAELSSQYNILSRKKLNELSDNREMEELINCKSFTNSCVFYQENLNDGKRIKQAYKTAFRQLSAVYYRRIAENGNVPSMVTLFELYPYLSNKEQEITDKLVISEILKSWAKEDVTQNLSVAIGKNEHGIVYLDLYEKADGPHMLVAGTTGSGKSETIITYLIGLCMKYSPTDLNLMLVDMKGGGFSDRLRNLPHCVGVVDDTAGESEGISAVYMLKRFLSVLNAEIKNRKILLKEFGVDNVDAYIRAEKTIAKILKGDTNPDLIKSLNPAQKRQLEKLKKENRKTIPLSHLVLVVDEFTELKRFSSESDDVDFISEITTIARIGRTLGFHIILVSQNIEGAITEDIRINSKSRICLKVATRAASKEMLDGRTEAASPTMPGNGRAYLLVGTGSKFIYFQSAYTGANKNQNIEPEVNMTQIMPCGTHNKKFYNSKKHNERMKLASKNINSHDTQLSYIVHIIEKIKSHNTEEYIYRIPMEIFKQPLARCYSDPTEWRLP